MNWDCAWNDLFFPQCSYLRSLLWPLKSPPFFIGSPFFVASNLHYWYCMTKSPFHAIFPFHPICLIYLSIVLIVLILIFVAKIFNPWAFKKVSLHPTDPWEVAHVRWTNGWVPQPLGKNAKGSGMGKCPNWTSPNYWDLSSQTDIWWWCETNPQKGTFTNPWR